MLTVVEQAGRAKTGQVIWLCNCECGNIAKVWSGALVREKGTRSCGCLKRRRRESSPNWKGGKTPLLAAIHETDTFGYHYPKWEKSKTKIVWDIDGVLMDRTIKDGGPEKYKSCFPIWQNINICNALYDKGYRIILWSSRGQTSCKDNPEALKDLEAFTIKQAQEMGIRFHECHLTKPTYDLMIDDRVFNVSEISSYEDVKTALQIVSR